MSNQPGQTMDLESAKFYYVSDIKDIK